MVGPTRRTFLAGAAAGIVPLTLPHVGRAAGLEIGSLLPDQGQGPTGLVILDDRTWYAAGMAFNGRDPVELAALLSEVAWTGDITRRFGPEPGVAVPSAQTSSLEVSLHQVGPDGASRLLAYFAADRTAAEGLQVAATNPLGDEVRGLVGAVSGGQEATVYTRFAARSASFVLRVTGLAAASPPMADVLSVCQAVLSNAGLA